MVWDYAIRIAGITRHQDCPIRGRQCVHGPDDITTDQVLCEREPHNAVDPHAIVVWVVGEEINKHLGYIPREIALNIPDDRLPCYGRIVWKGTDDRFGVRIEI